MSLIKCSTSSITFGLAGPPYPAFILKPLYVWGLWLAVMMIPAVQLSFFAPRLTMGVLTNPLAKCTTMPWEAKIRAVSSANISPPNRQSWPTTQAGSSDWLFSHFAVAMATLLTLAVVNWSAIISRQPSVPNLILYILMLFNKIVHTGSPVTRNKPIMLLGIYVSPIQE